MQELEKINIEYNIKICDGNRQKLALINSVDRIHGLSHSIDNITEHIAGAQACLQNMMGQYTANPSCATDPTATDMKLTIRWYEPNENERRLTHQEFGEP